MSIRILLDGGSNNVYTNLDVISGKVIMGLNREETFTAIVVKLECESRTRLAAPRDDRRGDRYDQELEVHKLLYKTNIVFPSAQLQTVTQARASYTLPAGKHEFPFHFKIPFNNACAPVNSMIDRMEMARDYNQHVKRALPPSLSGFPGEAEIRYFVKVTAQRAAFYKENFREECTFKFLPIEPIRPPSNKRESFARRSHQFAPFVDSKQSNMFKKSAPPSGPPPNISIDGRLPDPAIVTCNEPLPLRVIVRKLNETKEMLFLNLFQLVLIGYTRVRAHELQRVETGTWVIVSKANLRVALGNSSVPAETEMEIDPKMWNTTPLLSSVSPSFETCNLSRHYELEISIGIVFGTPGHVKPELTVQRLVMPCQVYSGIKPTAALLMEMTKRQNIDQLANNINPHPLQGTQASQIRPPPFVANPVPSDMASPQYSAAAPGRLPTIGAPAMAPEEPPPSYEDAMAEDLGPVDGPRRHYGQPQSGSVVGDDKRGPLFGQ